MAKNLEIALLFDFYGDMLTDKQRDVVELYYDNDLSLSEIAENEGITRQGVRDSIKRAEAQLLDMIAISESTPGPIGINMATYTGYTVEGIVGAVIATLGIVIPTVILVLCIAKFLESFKDNKYVLGAMYGLRPASTGLIAAAGVSVAVLSLVNTDAFMAREWASVVEPKSIVLAAILLILTNKVKKTKNLHPVFYIAASAVVGIVFHFAGI